MATDLHYITTIVCPHCGSTVALCAVQGDRCPGCQLEFTLFEAGQDFVAHHFYQTITGEKYLCKTPEGGMAIAHG